MKFNKLYLLLLFPLILFIFFNISLRRELNKFIEVFEDYEKVQGYINNLNCNQHGSFSVIHKNSVYREVLPYTFTNCLSYKEKESIEFYISKVSPYIATVNLPSNVIKEYEFQIKTSWLVLVFFGIPITIFITIIKKVKKGEKN